MAFHHPDILQLQSDYVDIKYIDSDLRPEFPEDGPRGDAGGLSREYVLRVPSVS